MNFGGIGGALIGALIIQRLGSRITILTLSAVSVAGAIIATASPAGSTEHVPADRDVRHPGRLAERRADHDVCAGERLATNPWRGIRTAVAVARIGSVLASFVGMFALDLGGTSAFFSVCHHIGHRPLLAGNRAASSTHVERLVAAKVGAPAGH
jgi:hypothetical protein